MQNDEIMIEFEHVTKMYKLFKNDKRRLLSTFSKKIPYKEKKAVNDVSFQIKRGESVALFGRNGWKINNSKNDYRSMFSNRRKYYSKW